MGYTSAKNDIIAHGQPDDFTAGTSRQQHMRFCSNISLKESTNSFARGEREEKYLDKIFHFKKVYPSINVLLEQAKVQIGLRYWLTKTRHAAKG